MKDIFMASLSEWISVFVAVVVFRGCGGVGSNFLFLPG